jgi:glucosylceramidase
MVARLAVVLLSCIFPHINANITVFSAGIPMSKPAKTLLFTLLLAFQQLSAVPSGDLSIYQTTRKGDRLKETSFLQSDASKETRSLTLDCSKTFQTIIGIGGSFTESSAYVLSELSREKQAELVSAYFSPAGAHISLTRTHIASCDFSVRNYTYAPVPGDTSLKHFSVEPDKTYLLPMIRQAQAVEDADFKILSSAWTPPPWMKTNNTWNGGELKPEYYTTFADYIVKYIQTYAGLNIPVWGITPINEPLGNSSNWESCHFTPETMRTFIADHLGPAIEKAGLDTSIWIFDQNRDEELIEWTETILGDPKAAAYVEGTAVHWYQSTVDIGGENLDHLHSKFPDKKILHSEGCVDALGDDEPIGSWLEDDWYWRPEATDWGKFWALPEKKKDHPPYRAFYRYARDLIGGLNHNMVAWIDWNMILNTRGGPNHARNFCLAPVLVDSGTDSIYYTPLFYAIAHVSKFVRPGAVRIGLDGHDDNFMATAFKNPDDSIAVVVFNSTMEDVDYSIQYGDKSYTIEIEAQALQSIVIQ